MTPSYICNWVQTHSPLYPQSTSHPLPTTRPPLCSDSSPNTPNHPPTPPTLLPQQPALSLGSVPTPPPASGGYRSPTTAAPPPRPSALPPQPPLRPHPAPRLTQHALAAPGGNARPSLIGCRGSSAAEEAQSIRLAPADAAEAGRVFPPPSQGLAPPRRPADK